MLGEGGGRKDSANFAELGRAVGLLIRSTADAFITNMSDKVKLREVG